MPIEPDIPLDDELDEIAISRTKTTPQAGRIRISFVDGDGIAYFAELIATLARLGKTVELSIKVIDE